MEVVQDETELNEYFAKTGDLISPDKPVLVDYYLEGAHEVDVDLISDGETYVIGGVMEHIEEAGIHSGDSACCLPPHTLKAGTVERIKEQAVRMAKELGVVGLMNVQFAVKGEDIYVLEVNPRASRTVPFVSKAIGRPLAKLAAQCMAGKKLSDPALDFTREITPVYFSVKEAVLPFVKFHGVDIILGPEMKSTGEVMGIDRSFARAYAKSQIAAGSVLPVSGTVFLSVKDRDKDAAIDIGKRLSDLGFEIVATKGTAKMLADAGVTAKPLCKLQEGSPNVLDLINRKAVNLIINTPSGARPRKDEVTIRSSAVSRGVSCITTIAGAQASVRGIETMIQEDLHVRPMQEYHKEKVRPAKAKA